MKLAEAYVEVKTNQAKFGKELKGMETSVNTSTGRMQKKFSALAPSIRKIGIGMAAAGAAIVAAGVLSIKTYSKMGDEVGKMAKRTGFSTEALSELRHAAEISGASLGSMEKGVKRMSGTILDAQDGLETYIRSFKHIGIEVKELEGLKPEEQFLKIAEAIAKVEDPTKRAAVAQDIFGRAGTDLLPLFAEGAEGMAKLRQEAHDLGIVFSEEAAKKAEDMTDAMHRVGEATSGLKIALADALIPVLMPLMDRVKEIISGMKDWMKAHPGLTSALAKLAVVLGPLLIALGGLLIILPSLVAALPMLGVAFHAMLGPVGLVILAITAAVAAFIYFYKTNEGFKKFIDTKILPPLKAIWEGFKAVGKGLMFMIKNWKETWRAARQISDATLGQIGKTIWKFFTDWSVFKAGLNLWYEFGKALTMTWAKTLEMLGTILVRVTSIIWAPLIKSLQWVADNIKYYFALGIEKARNAIIEGINYITSKVFVPMANIFVDVANKMTQGAEAFVNFFISGMNVVTKAIKPVINALGWFAKNILRKELPDSIKEFGEIAGVEFKKIEKLGKDALTIKIPESTLKQPAKFTARMSEAWDIIKDQYSKIPGDLRKYVDDLSSEWSNVTKAAEEFGVAVDWSAYLKKITGLIEKLKAAGVDTTALEEKQKEINKELDKTKEKLDAIDKRIKVVGSTITDWMQKKIEKANAEWERGAKIIAGLSQSVKNYGTTITDWVMKPVEEVNKKLEEGIKIIEGLSQSTKKYGSTITDWVMKPIEKANEELTKAKEIIDALSQKIKNYGTTITDWVQKPIEKANARLEEGIKIIEALAQKTTSLGTTITDWVVKPIEEVNRAWEKGKGIIKALSQSTVNLGTTITDWVVKPIKEANEKFEEGIKIIEALTQKTRKYGSTITDWVQKPIEKVNREWQKGEEIIKTLISSAKHLGSTITDWIPIQKQAADEMERAQRSLDALSLSMKSIPVSTITNWVMKQGDLNKELGTSIYWIELIESILSLMPPLVRKELEKILKLWREHQKEVKGIWESISEAIKSTSRAMKSAFSDAVFSILTGAKSMDEAFTALATTIRETIIKALINVAIQAAITGNAVLAVVAGIAAAFLGLARNVEETVHSSSESFLNAVREMEEAIGRLVGSTIAGMRTMAAEIAVEFEAMGMSMSRTLDEAQRKLEGLYQSQADLGASTREKLINELDKYYDYRVLKEKSLEELLALSAETRVGIEQGTISEVEESEEEQEARRKDRAISRLQQIEDQYKKEDELLRRKIALTEIEIKLLEYKLEREAHGNSARARMLKEELEDMLAAYRESVEAFEDAEERKQEATEDTTEVVKEETGEQAKTVKDAAEGEVGDVKGATERMGEFWNDLTAEMIRETEKTFGKTGAVPIALSEAINVMIEKMGELPTRIDFDVIGNLHMPSIPSISTRYFDIIGRFKTEGSFPSAQVGIPYIPRTMPVVVHKEEAILNPPQAREWRAGGAGGGKGEISIGTIQLLLPGVKTSEDLERMSPAAWKRVLDSGLIKGMKMSAVDGNLSKESVKMR